jgi:hypothetical protein
VYIPFFKGLVFRGHDWGIDKKRGDMEKGDMEKERGDKEKGDEEMIKTQITVYLYVLLTFSADHFPLTIFH